MARVLNTALLRQKALGFTLLEVMVATAIFAVAGLAVMNATSQGLTALSRLEDNTFATWVASNQLAEIKLKKEWPSTSWVSGKQILAGHEWHWRWHGVKTEDSGFMMVEVEVRAEEKSENPTTTLITYFGK